MAGVTADIQESLLFFGGLFSGCLGDGSPLPIQGNEIFGVQKWTEWVNAQEISPAGGGSGILLPILVVARAPLPRHNCAL
jgi:hypothetical protein